jgi:hypothetical protein
MRFYSSGSRFLQETSQRRAAYSTLGSGTVRSAVEGAIRISKWFICRGSVGAVRSNSRLARFFTLNTKEPATVRIGELPLPAIIDHEHDGYVDIDSNHPR